MSNDQGKEVPTPAPRPGRRWPGRLIRVLLSAFVTSFLFGAVLLLVLVYSEEGLIQAHGLLEGLLPENIRVEGVEGTLAGPLELRGIRYSDETQQISIDSLRLEWRPQALFTGTLKVISLDVTGVEVITTDQSASAEPVQLPDIILPIRVNLERARIQDVRMGVAGAEPVPLFSQLELGLELAGSGLNLHRLELELPDIRLSAAGTLAPSGDYPLQMRVDWRYSGLPGEPLTGDGALSGDLKRLEVSHRFAGGLEAELTGELRELLSNPLIDVQLDVKAVDPRRLNPEWPAMDLKGKFSASGGLDDLSAAGSFEIGSGEYGTAAGEFELGWLGGPLELRRIRVSSDSGLVLEGAAQWSGSDLQADVQWKDLVWPLSGDSQFRSKQGEASVTGALSDYRFTVTGEFSGRELPDTRIALNGTGDQQQATLSGLTVQTLEGRVTGAGAVAWAPGITWRADLAAADLNPGVQWPAWAGRLGGEVSLRGGMQDGKPDARLDIRSIDGSLRGYPLKVRGALGLRGNAFEAEGVELTSGGSRLTAQGTLAQAWDLQWTLVSDNLASLWPGAAGSIDAGGALSGDPALPQISAHVSGSGLGMDNHRVATLEGSFKVDLGKGDRFDTLVRATGLESAGRTWEALELKGSGNRAAHRLNVSLTGGLPDLRAALDGGSPETGVWQGKLTQLDLDGRELGNWRLEKPAALVLSGERMSLDRTCLLEGGGSLCVDASRLDDGTLQGKANLDSIPLAWLGALVPDSPVLDGMINAAMDFRIDTAGEVRGRLSIDIPRGLARLNIYGHEEELDYSGSRVRARADGKGVEAEVVFALKRGGGLEGRLALPGWSVKHPDRPGQPLEGALKANLEDLGSFSALVPNLDEVRGRIEADLKLSGTFSQPGIKGFARLSGAGFELAPLGLKLESIDLEARNRGLNEIVYSGGLVSGEGRLGIGGSTRLDPSQGWPTRLTLKGQDLAVADIPEVWMLVSPDLQLDMVNRRVGLEGEILVPRARIRPRSLPDTAVAPSPDVRIVNARGEVAEQDPLQVNASIRLRLGDQVSFDGFGVRGLIRGNLLLTDAPGKPTLGNGQVSIEEGTYKAYGQDLRIRQGRAIFANSLLTDPAIAVNAVRQVQDVEVGLNVSGTLKKPVLEVFSSPAMSQSEALSYLLFGKPVGRTTSGSDRDAVQSATNSLAAGGGNLLGAEIGRQMGLDELSFQSAGEDGKDIALQVGAYLSPRLYIQYITELAAASNQVKLRYDLTERIQIQTETGTVHGADVFYTIER